MRPLAVALLALLGLAAPLGAQLPPALRPLRFLIGEWEALPGADASAGTGRATFAASLQDHVIARTSFAAYFAAAGQPGSRHDDLMVIHAEGDSVRADYFDSEGHVIRYAVHARAPGEVEFASDPVPSEPRYRLTYTLRADSAVAGRFEIAPPGAGDAFRPYLTWVTRRVGGGSAQRAP